MLARWPADPTDSFIRDGPRAHRGRTQVAACSMPPLNGRVMLVRWLVYALVLLAVTLLVPKIYFTDRRVWVLYARVAGRPDPLGIDLAESIHRQSGQGHLRETAGDLSSAT